MRKRRGFSGRQLRATCVAGMASSTRKRTVMMSFVRRDIDIYGGGLLSPEGGCDVNYQDEARRSCSWMRRLVRTLPRAGMQLDWTICTAISRECNLTVP